MKKLVVLQKRGERNYFEFDLTKSKQFSASDRLLSPCAGPIPKHMNYDMSMVVDDNQLSKKRVNLLSRFGSIRRMSLSRCRWW